MKVRTKVRAGTITLNHNGAKATKKAAKKIAPSAKDLVGVKVSSRIKAGLSEEKKK